MNGYRSSLAIAYLTTQALPGYSLPTKAIPRALTAPGLYWSANGLLARAQHLLSQTANHWLLDLALLRNRGYFVKVKVTLRLTDSQSVSLGVEPPFGAHDQIFFTVWHLRSCLCGALSDERTGLSFVYAAGPCQRGLSRVRVPWNSRQYFTVSDSRLTFSSPPTTRRVTVEVFDPASTRVSSRTVFTASRLPSALQI
jgi:hypothetical protein